MFKDRNKNLMKEFETMINTADDNLAEKLISNKASFYTPASKEPLYGSKGYLSLVHFLRTGFSDIQWKLEETVAEGNIFAVNWICSGTHDGEFMGVKPTGRTFSANFMNFYYFDNDGMIINDVAAVGMVSILKTLGLCP